MPNKRTMDRRTFVAGAASALAAPTIVPSSVFGQNAPSKRVVLASIGVGGMGRGNTNGFLRNDDCQVVAVCDADQNNLQKGADQVNKKYGNKDCKMVKDYREILAMKDVDAVLVATPDHWHGIISVAAANAKKDIYCQKPMTHLFAEGRALADAVKKNNCIFQVGSQQRSGKFFRYAVELVMNGHIGKVHKVEVGLPTGRRNSPKAAPNQTPPDHLDYDLWCGPSEKLPYMKERLHFNWRWNYAYGGGQLMDWIGHHNDINHWAMGWDNSGPVEVWASDFEYPDDKSVFDAAWKYRVNCVYPGGVESTIAFNDRKLGGNEQGTRWYGDKGSIHVSRRAFWIYDKEGKKDEEASKRARKDDFDRGPKKAYHSSEHHRNFLDGVKTRKPCICPAETGHRSITPGHLGLISQAVGGKKLQWDAKTETITNHAEADKLLKALPYRAPWKLLA